MKKNNLYMLLILCSLLGWFAGCTKNGNNTAIERNTESTVPYENENPNETAEILGDDNEKAYVKIELNNSDFSEVIRRTAMIREGEQLEKAEWIIENVLFRVAIERKEELEGEYRHISDYIYVKKDDEVKSIEVTYPRELNWNEDRHLWSNCNFDVIYEDVTFDGNEDVLISLGEAGNSSMLKYCAYVYDDGEFSYKKSFEEICNYKINNEERIIEGWYTGEAHNDHYVYKYVDGDFVFESVDIYEYDFDKNEYLYVKTIDSIDELIGVGD